MGLRPSAAHWFELLVTRDDLAATIDILAHTSLVELEAYGEPVAASIDSDTGTLTEEFDELERQYGQVWPVPRTIEPAERVEPGVLMRQAILRLRDWSATAEGIVGRLRDL